MKNLKTIKSLNFTKKSLKNEQDNSSRFCLFLLTCSGFLPRLILRKATETIGRAPDYLVQGTNEIAFTKINKDLADELSLIFGTEKEKIKITCISKGTFYFVKFSESLSVYAEEMAELNKIFKQHKFKIKFC